MGNIAKIESQKSSRKKPASRFFYPDQPAQKPNSVDEIGIHRTFLRLSRWVERKPDCVFRIGMKGEGLLVRRYLDPSSCIASMPPSPSLSTGRVQLPRIRSEASSAQRERRPWSDRWWAVVLVWSWRSKEQDLPFRRQTFSNDNAKTQRTAHGESYVG